MASRKRPVILQEGPDAAEHFDNAMSSLLRVSKEELAKREAAHQEARKDKPRRGPKPTARRF